MTSKKKKQCNVNPDQLTKRGLNQPAKIFCAYFGHIYIFIWCIISICSCRCLNILKFGHRFHFWDKKFGCTVMVCYFWAVFCPYLTNNFISHVIVLRSARAWFQMFEWGLQSIYINHKSYKKFMVKPNWVKIWQILWGQYCPPWAWC